MAEYDEKKRDLNSEITEIMEKLGKDEKFRTAFVNDPVATLKAEGHQLTSNDEKMLKSVDFKRLGMTGAEFSMEKQTKTRGGGSCGGYCNVG